MLTQEPFPFPLCDFSNVKLRRPTALTVPDNDSKCTSAPAKFSGSLFIQENWHELDRRIYRNLEDDINNSIEIINESGNQSKLLNLDEEIHKIINSERSSCVRQRSTSKHSTSLSPTLKNSNQNPDSCYFQPKLREFGGSLLEANNTDEDSDSAEKLKNEGVFNSEHIGTFQTLNSWQKNFFMDDFESTEFMKNIKNACNAAKDQAGCRMLQRWLDKKDPFILTLIFEQIIDRFSELIVDPFGNYLCQKIAETCSSSQLLQILKCIANDMKEICNNPHGTRAVQKLFEIVGNDDNITIMTENLREHVVDLVKDNNGNHVVQKCLLLLNDKNKQFIYDSIILRCSEVATHKHGCCVIQRCLDHGSKKQREALSKVIAHNTLNLVKDQYGNYVVQYVLDLVDHEEIKIKIAESLSGDIVELSKQKFSSNVIEKCLRYDIPGFKEKVVEAIGFNHILPGLLIDKYANYVVQSCLSISKGEQKNRLFEILQKQIKVITRDEFGYKIFLKICKLYPEVENFLPKSNDEKNNQLANYKSFQNKAPLKQTNKPQAPQNYVKKPLNMK